MPSSSASRSSSYTPLSIPGVDRKKSHTAPAHGVSKIEYLDEHRPKPHTGTFRYDHDFERTQGTPRNAYMVTGQHLRLQGHGSQGQPRMDGRRSGSVRPPQRAMDFSAPQEAAYSRTPQHAIGRQPAQRPDRRPQQGRGAHGLDERPDLGSVTDFRTIAPTTAAPRPESRPTVIDPDSGLPVRPKPQKKGKRRRAAREEEPQAAVEKEPLMHEIEPRASDPKRHEVGARLDAGDSTVIGFDISKRKIASAKESHEYAKMVRKQRAKNKAARKKARRRIRTAVAVVLTCAVIFAACLGLLVRYSQIASLSQSNAALVKANADLSEEINRRRVEMSLDEDLGDVQDRAAAMGMRAPDDSQIEHVVLSSEEAPASSLEQARANAALQAQQSRTGFLDIIWDWISSVFGRKSVIEQ